jgi:hypothetical protein
MSLRSASVNENCLMVVILSASEGSALRFGDQADSSALPQNDIQEFEESTPFSKEDTKLRRSEMFPQRRQGAKVRKRLNLKAFTVLMSKLWGFATCGRYPSMISACAQRKRKTFVSFVSFVVRILFFPVLPKSNCGDQRGGHVHD